MKRLIYHFVFHLISWLIAYHGDVINTAARIQEQCNFFDRKLIVSKIIYDNLEEHPWMSERIGEVELKGKKQPVVVYSLSIDK